MNGCCFTTAWRSCEICTGCAGINRCCVASVRQTCGGSRIYVWIEAHLVTPWPRPCEMSHVLANHAYVGAVVPWMRSVLACAVRWELFTFPLDPLGIVYRRRCTFVVFPCFKSFVALRCLPGRLELFTPGLNSLGIVYVAICGGSANATPGGTALVHQ